MEKIKSGDTFLTNQGGSVIVLSYRGYDKIVIQHMDMHGHICRVRSQSLKEGRIKNPFHPSVVGVGYVGVGEYDKYIGRKPTAAYLSWKSMLTRAYCKKFHRKYSWYSQCSVDKKWHNFQNFAEWFYRQPNAGKKGFHLDKDLIIIGNKKYSEETCSFVPAAINCLFSDHRIERGEYKTGVSKQYSKFCSHLNIDGKLTHLGTYNTEYEAWKAYTEAKCENAKVLAKRYEHVINAKVYENLINWRFDQ